MLFVWIFKQRMGKHSCYIYTATWCTCVFPSSRPMYTVRESTKVLDSGSQHLDSGFQPFGFRIPTFWIPDSIPKWIPDSKPLWIPDSSVWIPDSNSKHLLDSRFWILYMGQLFKWSCPFMIILWAHTVCPCITAGILDGKCRIQAIKSVYQEIFRILPKLWLAFIRKHGCVSPSLHEPWMQRKFIPLSAYWSMCTAVIPVLAELYPIYFVSINSSL